MRDRLGKVTRLEKPRWLRGGIGTTGQERAGRQSSTRGEYLPFRSTLTQRRISNLPLHLIPFFHSPARKGTVFRAPSYDFPRAKILSTQFLCSYPSGPFSGS